MFQLQHSTSTFVDSLLAQLFSSKFENCGIERDKKFIKIRSHSQIARLSCDEFSELIFIFIRSFLIIAYHKNQFPSDNHKGEFGWGLHQLHNEYTFSTCRTACQLRRLVSHVAFGGYLLKHFAKVHYLSLTCAQ